MYHVKLLKEKYMYIVMYTTIAAMKLYMIASLIFYNMIDCMPLIAYNIIYTQLSVL